jgi:hypothetical protein
MAQNTAENKFSDTTMLGLEKKNIGKFVGAKGSLIRKHVVNRSRDIHAKELGVPFKDVPSPHVSIKYLSEDDVVVAECSASSEELLKVVMSLISKHMTHVSAERPARSPHPNQKVPVPATDRVVHLNFKTNIDNHLVGKFIGAGGKNCKSLSEDLLTIAKDLGASSFRVRLIQPDIYGSNRTPKQFFTIKNQGSDEVFIHVSAKFSGHPRELFLAIKSRMIESVVSLMQPTPGEPCFLDSPHSSMNLPQYQTPVNPFGGAAQSTSYDADDGESCPVSPRYCDSDES